MHPNGFIPANFTISESACAGIEHLRSLTAAHFQQPMVAAGISWGHIERNDIYANEQVVVGFYGLSDMTPALWQSVQTVNGINIVFFITQAEAHNFAGREIDFADDRGFFLRAGNTIAR